MAPIQQISHTVTVCTSLFNKMIKWVKIGHLLINLPLALKKYLKNPLDLFQNEIQIKVYSFKK